MSDAIVGQFHIRLSVENAESVQEWEDPTTFATASLLKFDQPIAED